MAPISSTVATKSAPSPYQLDPDQTLRAAKALVRKIQSDDTVRKSTDGKASLLADADTEEAEDDVPVWLVLTTKKHIVDKKRLKPGKIVLPHPYLSLSESKDSDDASALRICLITADPQRKYKDLITHPSFPLEVSKHITRVIGIEKIKSKYNTFESKRQLLGEYDVFLADDRVITYLPKLLGKPFYKGGAKRPIPVTLEGKRQSVDEQGNKRRKLAEGGTKVVKDEVKPTDVAAEIKRAIGSALVHLAPSTTTAVKVGIASNTPEQIQDNVVAVVNGLVETYVPQKWRNVRSIHIKGPNTAALPIWMTEELWTDEKDVLEQLPPTSADKAAEKKRKRGALTAPDVIEVPGPDGKMRRLEKPDAKKRKSLDAAEASEPDVATAAAPTKKRKSEGAAVEADGEDKTAEKAEKAARKEALKKQKEVVRAKVDSVAGAVKPKKRAVAA